MVRPHPPQLSQRDVVQEGRIVTGPQTGSSSLERPHNIQRSCNVVRAHVEMRA